MQLCIVSMIVYRVSSKNLGGGKLTDHVAIWPRQGEGRLHNYNILGGGGGGGGEVELFGGGGGKASPAPPPR